MNTSKSVSAFEIGTPSLFVLASPLQAICAIEAIHKFKIMDYKILLLVIDDIRNSQLYTLLDQMGYRYTIFKSTSVNTNWNRLKVLWPCRKGFRRVFIGDPRSFGQFILAYKYCLNGAKVVYLDDGDDNIFLLKGHKFKPNRKLGYINLFYYYKFVPLTRRIDIGRYLYTIYADINNPYYICVANTFNFFSNNQSLTSSLKNVYFVGTNYSRYCESGNFPEELVKEGLERSLATIKNKYLNDNIIYIAHGRDVATFPIDICKKYGIKYFRPPKTVELMFLDLDIIPKAVYGFTSTALYNIKLLFPQSSVYNLTFEVNHTSFMIEQTKVITEYYRDHGIPEIKL